MTETELMTRLKVKKVALRNETDALERFRDELNAAKEADKRLAEATRKAQDLLTQDPIPMREASKAKSEMIRAFPATKGHRPIPRIEADVEERQKRVGTLNAEIFNLAKEISDGWTEETENE